MMNVNVNLDVDKVSSRLSATMKKQLQPALDTQVLKDSNYFVPMDTGNLKSSGVRATIPGSGVVQWNTPYAKKMYYGVDYNFSLESNPHARAKWFEEAKKQYKSDWIKMLQKGME